MRIRSKVLALLLLLALVPGLAVADSAIMEELGSKAAKKAMQDLKMEKGDADLLILTNAGHAIVDGQTTQAALKGLSAESGNSIGDANLFQVLRPHWKPVWFYFFDKATGEAVFLQADSQALSGSQDDLGALPEEKLFSKISNANVDIDYLRNNTDEGNATFDGKAFNGNEFSLAGISNVWARGGAFDFIQATCFHDHLCPGVTSGLFLAKYVEEKLPINNISAESYKVIACPNWCKDDLLQMRWDATPGKSSMFVMALTDAEKKAVPGIAGIYIRWNDTVKEGDALALGYNFSAVELPQWTGPAWGSKLYQDIVLMPYVDTPEAFITVLKEFKVDAAKLAQMQNAGMHPLKVAGVM
ncbi:MAG: FmdE, Molybdenum formylmethanofuran dehydrogenase operon [Euryarchaeota archaeon ADurb.Bin190]|nr:MAG: FmdE, Molybdenum formylmethanofuran dehydrogenase operon [Euryarchaeota archaeon ADurb.Bin190]